MKNEQRTEVTVHRIDRMKGFKKYRIHIVVNYNSKDQLQNQKLM
jgi:hypothetical protein